MGLLDRIPGAVRDELQRPRPHPAARHRRDPRATRLRRPPELRLDPGRELAIARELAWHADRAAFLAAHPPPFEVPELIAEGEHGESYVRHGRSRIAIARHAPLGEIVRRRTSFILEHQRATHRAGEAAGALLPYDLERGLTVPGAGWKDFGDGRERLGMGLLLQEALRHGNADDPERTDAAAEAFRRFVTHELLTDTHELRSDSHRPEASTRLYDIPWLVLLLAEHDPDRALAAPRLLCARWRALPGDRRRPRGPGPR